MASRPVRSRRHPLVVAFLAVCVLSGVLGTISPEFGSRTITELMPGYAPLWNVLLALGGGVALVGVLSDQGLLVERAGVLTLGGLFAAYATGICIVDDAWLSTGSAVIGGLGIGCLLRFRQIGREIADRLRDVGQGPDA